ncbi:uroporphyrinogen decarboxylase family protein [Neomoorella thermoacetica]|uniref:Methionine synthase n=1 Tax=Neomoorella thermoacetica TaxID=1525 RepID=A0A1J5PCG6_NEOTH|nr:uroporphyrinogen decarboxylase family protein [Moorella thermoacetica]OIQ07897.1 methionine synthase [Moorella thermoacetica]OIQ61421.1 methionine synthase [Moorella thermoacetica]
MRLIDLVNQSGRRLVFFIGSFPGAAMKGVTLKEVYFSASLQAETACYLAERFQIDFIRPVTDLVVEAEAMGLQARYPDNGAPVLVEHPITGPEALADLNLPEPGRDGRLPINLEAIRLIKQRTDKPVIGSLTGPFTLAGALCDPAGVAMKTITDPEFLHALLAFCTRALKRYGEALLAAGADILWISEPLGSLLSPAQFWQFSGRYIQEIFAAFPAMNILHICGDTSYMLKEMLATGAQGLSLDSRVSLPVLATQMPEDVVLIGNIDPVGVMLEGSPQQVVKATANLLTAMLPFNNFIVSTGCTLPFEVPAANISAFVETARNFPCLSPSQARLLLSLRRALLEGDSEGVTTLTRKGLQLEMDAITILEGGLIQGINRAGELYQQQKVFIPELLLISQAMYAGLEVIRPVLVQKRHGTRGKIVLGTVQGDLHDIGKNLVGLMLTANDFQVIDLGKDVTPEQFVEAVGACRPQVVGLSALTTTTMKSMEKTVRALKQGGQGEQVKVIVGGAPITPEFARRIGADAYAPDAAAAVTEVANLIDKVKEHQDGQSTTGVF